MKILRGVLFELLSFRVFWNILPRYVMRSYSLCVVAFHHHLYDLLLFPVDDEHVHQFIPHLFDFFITVFTVFSDYFLDVAVKLIALDLVVMLILLLQPSCLRMMFLLQLLYPRLKLFHCFIYPNLLLPIYSIDMLSVSIKIFISL